MAPLGYAFFETAAAVSNLFDPLMRFIGRFTVAVAALAVMPTSSDEKAPCIPAKQLVPITKAQTVERILFFIIIIHLRFFI